MKHSSSLASRARSAIVYAVTLILMLGSLTSCSEIKEAAGSHQAQLAGSLVIDIVRNKQVQMALTRGAQSGSPASALRQVAVIVGVYTLKEMTKIVLENRKSQYIQIQHIVDGRAVTTVVEVKDDSRLGVKVQGEADVYPFRDGKFIFDALPYERSKITVFRTDKSVSNVSVSGTVPLSFTGAYDIETGQAFKVDEPQRLPLLADLYLSEGGIVRLINGARVISRKDVAVSLESCSKIPASAWAQTLEASSSNNGEGTWCLRTSEGSVGKATIKGGQWLEPNILAYELWAE